jgi:hypothetical protein
VDIHPRDSHFKRKLQSRFFAAAAKAASRVATHSRQ